MRIAVNVVVAYAAWFAVAWLAARGDVLLAAVPSLAAIGVHLLTSPAAERPGEVRLALAAGAIGLAADTVHAALGLVDFGQGQLFGVLPPLFMIALWMAFASMLNVSLAWLRGRWALAAVLGAAGGAASYYAGAKLGAIGLGDPLWRSLAGIGAVWAFVFPLLMWLSGRLGGQPRS